MARRFRVFVGGRALVSYLELPLWETARAALGLLAEEPRPRWAVRTTTGYSRKPPLRFAPGGGFHRSWVGPL